MTEEQLDLLIRTKTELLIDAEHLREDEDCDKEADHNEELADAIDAALAEIDRQAKRIESAIAILHDAELHIGPSPDYGLGMRDLADSVSKALEGRD